jgi:hypothetical protein
VSIPHWPAALRRSDAASYCSLSVTKFEQEIVDGRLPEPFLLGGTEHWHRAKLDAALANLAGGIEEDWRERAGLPRRAA